MKNESEPKLPKLATKPCIAKKCIFLLLVTLLSISLSACVRGGPRENFSPTEQNMKMLISQLEGTGSFSRYWDKDGVVCEVGDWAWSDLYPRRDAAELIGKIGPAGRIAVPALISVLRRPLNEDTGDGIVTVRAAAAKTLAALNATEAIPVLVQFLEEQRKINQEKIKIGVDSLHRRVEVANQAAAEEALDLLR